MTKQSTKQKLAQTLKALMATTPVDRITIDMLTQRAHLTRNTFYYHFDDIYSLLEWVYKQDLLVSVTTYTQITDWKVAYQLILDYIETNKQFCMNTFRSVARDLLEGFLYSVASDLVGKVIIHSNRDVSPNLTEAIKNFYGWALVMQVVQWLANDLKEPKAAVVHRAEIMLRGGIDNAIKNGQELSGFGQNG
ncbi:TetR/AcrR family transcriptional regulator [Lactobacillus helveticus]|uniref:TetR/AcrR family transcriptional regulator n=1 Tax=Lactobacillus helveticus TaxID=1587 RepID=UPI00197C20CA|nr:TetR-like C-terminal domain-containing protein [Lactobacillus helveticus]MBN6049485.1 TetR family transcriptional regulator C-terminal domain-containing protein [Lactobacillus helveticus]